MCESVFGVTYTCTSLLAFFGVANVRIYRVGSDGLNFVHDMVSIRIVVVDTFTEV